MIVLFIMTFPGKYFLQEYVAMVMYRYQVKTTHRKDDQVE